MQKEIEQKRTYYFQGHEPEMMIDLACLFCGSEIHTSTMCDVTTFAANHRHAIVKLDREDKQ